MSTTFSVTQTGICKEVILYKRLTKVFLTWAVHIWDQWTFRTTSCYRPLRNQWKCFILQIDRLVHGVKLYSMFFVFLRLHISKCVYRTWNYTINIVLYSLCLEVFRLLRIYRVFRCWLPLYCNFFIQEKPRVSLKKFVKIGRPGYKGMGLASGAGCSKLD